MTKKYEDLEFTDNFMFVNIMRSNPDLCREMLELILRTKIRHIEIPKYERVSDPIYESKGIRVDIYTESDEDVVYDIEMQALSDPDIARRSRYYHSSLDMEQLETGGNYDQLRKTYVIFICKTNAGKGYTKPVYTFRYRADEDPEKYLDDGTYTVFVNADCSEEDLPDDMKAFLEFIRTGRSDGGPDTLAGRLNDVVTDAISTRKWSREYMIWADALKQSYREGYREGELKAQEEGKKMIFLLVQDGTISLKKGSSLLNIPSSELKEELIKNGYTLPLSE